MSSFFKSLFGNKTVTENEATEKETERNFDILKYDGVKALKMGKTGYAVRCFNEALKLRNDAETLEFLASAYLRLGDAEHAIETYNHLTSLLPDQADTFLQRAQLYLHQNREEEAITDCRHVLNIAEDYRAYLLIALAQNNLARYEEAIGNLTKACEIRNDVADIFLNRSKAYCELGEYEKAQEDADKAIELAPEEEAAYMQRAKIREAFQDYETALQDYATVTELNPFHEQAYLETGRILMEKQEIDKAINYFDEALEINPDFGKAYLARAEAKKLKGDNEGAQKDLETGNALCNETEKDVKRPVNFDDLYTNRPL